MRQIVLPQTGHVPFVMGLPFFVVLSTGFFILFFSLHFMQYASMGIEASFLRALAGCYGGAYMVFIS